MEFKFNGLGIGTCVLSTGGLRMKKFKILYGIAFACSIAMMFYAYHYFQTGNNTRALMSLVIGVVCGIVNFKSLVED